VTRVGAPILPPLSQTGQQRPQWENRRRRSSGRSGNGNRLVRTRDREYRTVAFFFVSIAVRAHARDPLLRGSTSNKNEAIGLKIVVQEYEDEVLKGGSDRLLGSESFEMELCLVPLHA
jgi:hypothetical protein